MNFLLSDEQQEFQTAVRRYLDGACPPAKLRAIFDGEDGFDAAVWAGFSKLGVTALAVPESYGGLGLKLIDLALVAETIGRTAAPLPFLGHSLATLAVAWGGSEAQKTRWLPSLASGTVLATVAFCDEGGWLPEQWTLAPGALSGCKSFVPNGQHADLFVVGLSGGALALVEKSAQSCIIRPRDGVDRTRRLADLHFEGVHAEVLPGSGVAERLRDAALVLLAADAFGGASRCIEMAIDYAKIRQQFGQPIGKFQGLKHQLANMAVEIEPARALYWYAAHAFDDIPADASRSAALAKSHLCDRYLQVARDAIEAHGGIGYTWEYDLQFWFKRAMFDYAFLGAPPQHRARVAALSNWSSSAP